MQATYIESNYASTVFSNVRGRLSASLTSRVVDDLKEFVYLIEPDCRMREELSETLEAFEMEVIGFASVAEYLSFVRRDAAGCLILESGLPDIDSLEWQRQLGEKTTLPVIFISSQCDVPSVVRAMKAGAMEFFAKPVDPHVLAAAIRTALAQDRRQRQKKADLAKLQQRASLLTPREREVFPLIVGGLLNKQAAAVLGISEVTLQIHRSQVMRKMEAGSFADLVRMAVKLRIPNLQERHHSTTPLPQLPPGILRKRTVDRLGQSL
jgi:FixJ family two-component response regulator